MYLLGQYEPKKYAIIKKWRKYRLYPFVIRHY